MTGFAADVARGAVEAATRLHFEATVIGFAAGGAARAAGRLDSAELLLVAGGFDDELAAARVALGRGWRAMGFVAAGVTEVLVSLGEAREGLIGPVQWIATAAPEPDEGPDVEWFSTRYRLAAGADPPYPAAQAFAAGVLAARCLREAGACDDAAQVAAARSLRCRTLYGDFRLDPSSGLQVGHEALTVQWQGGQRRVVWPPRHADRSLVYPR
jgi:branched-chain amino acid transport system substrate-binding protein